MPARPIRVLPDMVAPATRQLAASYALLAGLEQSAVPALRWYRIDPPALLLGSAQSPGECDPVACATAGIPVYQRNSGGGIVLADALLMCDLALPPADPLYTADLTESYFWLSRVWQAALAALGIDTQITSIATARADARTLDPLLKRVCFGGLSPYELVTGGRKLVGLAQVRRKAGALIQAGVYLQWDSRHTAALVAASGHNTILAALLDKRVTGLQELARLKPADLMHRIAVELGQQAGLIATPADWTEYEYQTLQAALARYQEM